MDKKPSKETEKAKNYSFRLLGLRPRSEKEIKKRLTKKGFSRKAISFTVEFLRGKKLIDDREFAKRWIESRLTSNPKGDIVLANELRMKGIEEKVIKEILEEKKENINQKEMILVLAEKKLSSLKGFPKNKIRRNIFSYLARRGFNFDTINDVITELLD